MRWMGGWLPVLVCVAGVSHQVVVNVRLKDEFTLATDVSLIILNMKTSTQPSSIVHPTIIHPTIIHPTTIYPASIHHAPSTQPPSTQPSSTHPGLTHLVWVGDVGAAVAGVPHTVSVPVLLVWVLDALTVVQEILQACFPETETRLSVRLSVRLSLLQPGTSHTVIIFQINNITFSGFANLVILNSTPANLVVIPN